MVNLTLFNGVVKANVPPAPMVGYKVVVLEEVKGGTKFKEIINPGDDPLKKKFRLFSQEPKFCCIAVKTGIDLSFKLTTELTLAAQHRHFTLNCDVKFSVIDPAGMAEQYKTDPVNKVREELKKKTQQNVLESKITLEEIRADFYNLREEILSGQAENKVNDFARQFGIDIKEIGMTYKIPEKFVAVETKKDDYRLEKELEFIDKEAEEKKKEKEKGEIGHKHDLRKIERELEIEEMKHQDKLQEINLRTEEKKAHYALDVADMESSHEFKREMPKRLIAAIDKAVESINNPESLRKASDAAISVINRVFKELNQTGKALAPGGVKALAEKVSQDFAADEMGPLEKTRDRLVDIIKAVERSSCEDIDRKSMLCSATHLLAETYKEEDLDKEVTEKYLDELRESVLAQKSIFSKDFMEKVKMVKKELKKIMESE